MYVILICFQHGRSAFGQALSEQPLMQSLLGDLCVEAEAHTLTAMRLAHAYDREQRGRASPEEAAFFRMGVAVGKYWVTKRLPNFTFEAMEVRTAVCAVVCCAVVCVLCCGVCAVLCVLWCVCCAVVCVVCCVCCAVCGVLCCGVLWCDVCAVLCDVLCYAMLCYIVLCWVALCLFYVHGYE
jgi:hypothetical protein